MDAVDFGASIGRELAKQAAAPGTFQNIGNALGAAAPLARHFGPRMLAGTGIGAGVGAGYGAYSAPKGQKLQGAGRGAIGGAATGAASGLLSRLYQDLGQVGGKEIGKILGRDYINNRAGSPGFRGLGGGTAQQAAGAGRLGGHIGGGIGKRVGAVGGAMVPIGMASEIMSAPKSTKKPTKPAPEPKTPSKSPVKAPTKKEAAVYDAGEAASQIKPKECPTSKSNIGQLTGPVSANNPGQVSKQSSVAELLAAANKMLQG